MIYSSIPYPSEPILELVFFKDAYSVSVNHRNYQIVGGDNELKTEVIGIDSEDEKVYFISLHEETFCYIAVNIEIFVKELLLYHRYMNSERNYLPESPSEAQLSEFTNRFKSEILKLDATAFRSNDTYWSEICEEMEYGICI